jgi:metal transporter CNNM
LFNNNYSLSLSLSLSLQTDQVKDVKINIDGEKPTLDKNFKSKRVLQKWKSFPNGGNNSYRGGSRRKKWSKDMYFDILQIDGNPLPKLSEEEEAVGGITMEDVIEELLQVSSDLPFNQYKVPSRSILLCL